MSLENNNAQSDENQKIPDEDYVEEQYELIDETNLYEIIQENIDLSIEKAFSEQENKLKTFISEEFSNISETIKKDNILLKKDTEKLLQGLEKIREMSGLIEVISKKLLIIEEENKKLKEQIEILPAKPEEICNILLTNADNMKVVLREKELSLKEMNLMEKEIKELTEKLDKSQAKESYFEAKLDALKTEIIKKEKNCPKTGEDEKKSWWENFF